MPSSFCLFSTFCFPFGLICFGAILHLTVGKCLSAAAYCHTTKHQINSLLFNQNGRFSCVVRAAESKETSTFMSWLKYWLCLVCFSEPDSIQPQWQQQLGPTAPCGGGCAAANRWPPRDSLVKSTEWSVGGAGTVSGSLWQHLQCTSAIVYLPLRGLANGAILIGPSLMLPTGGRIDSYPSLKQDEGESWLAGCNERHRGEAGCRVTPPLGTSTTKRHTNIQPF